MRLFGAATLPVASSNTAASPFGPVTNCWPGVGLLMKLVVVPGGGGGGGLTAGGDGGGQ